MASPGGGKAEAWSLGRVQPAVPMWMLLREGELEEGDFIGGGEWASGGLDASYGQPQLR